MQSCFVGVISDKNVTSLELETQRQFRSKGKGERAHRCESDKLIHQERSITSRREHNLGGGPHKYEIETCAARAHATDSGNAAIRSLF